MRLSVSELISQWDIPFLALYKYIQYKFTLLVRPYNFLACICNIYVRSAIDNKYSMYLRESLHGRVERTRSKLDWERPLNSGCWRVRRKLGSWWVDWSCTCQSVCRCRRNYTDTDRLPLWVEHHGLIVTLDDTCPVNDTPLSGSLPLVHAFSACSRPDVDKLNSHINKYSIFGQPNKSLLPFQTKPKAT